ncbi:hypothetical protein HR060_12910 [Catenovulum sp. SM1970]|uniref:hypothetical protein n=1 Tax=Marinifaba aquimaris TaxID=2741323 RepID=UPI001574D0F1|nr:hypothetical protein [Marinifaba aquimaris]NTS77758.1 hypothetical protein [Marinifaba aquimaris]
MKKTAMLLSSALLSMNVVASDLTGSWTLMSGEYIDGQGQVTNYQKKKLAATKVLSDGNFSFITVSHQGEKPSFWAAGAGSYTAKNGIYTETPEKASYPLEDGGVYKFQYKVEGDTWTKERFRDGKRVELEVWKRLD